MLEIRVICNLYNPGISSGADPGFFLRGGAPLRNDVTNRWGKQILKANTKTRRLHLRGGGTPCTLPLDPPLVMDHFSRYGTK